MRTQEGKREEIKIGNRMREREKERKGEKKKRSNEGETK